MSLLQNSQVASLQPVKFISLLHERDAGLPERHRLPRQPVSTSTCSSTSSSCAEWSSTKPHFSSTRLEPTL